jgi:hypothetical protein
MPRTEPATSPLLSSALPDELDLVTKHALNLLAGGREAAVAAFQSLPGQLVGPRPGEALN